MHHFAYSLLQLFAFNLPSSLFFLGYCFFFGNMETLETTIAEPIVKTGPKNFGNNWKQLETVVETDWKQVALNNNNFWKQIGNKTYMYRDVFHS